MNDEHFESKYRLLEPGESRRPRVSIQNLSFDPQGRMYKLTPSRLRRWWQARRGWTHYPGSHYSD